MKITLAVTPAQAGVHVARTQWIPAFAGMTHMGDFQESEARNLALIPSCEDQGEIPRFARNDKLAGLVP
jgi:hypothetical protein